VRARRLAFSLAASLVALSAGTGCEGDVVEDSSLVEPVETQSLAVTNLDDSFDDDGKLYLHNYDNLVANQVWSRAGAPVYAGSYTTAAGVKSVVIGAASVAGGTPAAGTYPFLKRIVVPGTTASEALALAEGGSDYKITFAGSARRTDGKTVAVLGRAGADGPDETFGDHGFVQSLYGAQSFSWQRVVRDGQGRLIAAGTGLYADGVYGVVARFGASGAVDFGFGGRIANGIRAGSTRWKIPTPPTSKVATISGLGRIGAGNDFYVGVASQQNAVLHFDANGDLDPGFGDGGRALFGDSDGRGRLRALLPLASGIYAGGMDDNGHMIVIAYKPDGSRQTSWGPNGARTVAVPESAREGIASLDYDAEIDRLYAGGFVARGNIDYFAALGFTMDGKLDPSFGNRGILVTDFKQSTTEHITSISLARIGARRTLLAAGEAELPDANGEVHVRTAVARYELAVGHVGEPCAYDTCLGGTVCVAETCRLGEHAGSDIDVPLGDFDSRLITPGQKVHFTGLAPGRRTWEQGDPPIFINSCRADDTSAAVFTDPCYCGNNNRGCVNGIPLERARFATITPRVYDLAHDRMVSFAATHVVFPEQLDRDGVALVPFRAELELPASDSYPQDFYRWEYRRNGWEHPQSDMLLDYELSANGDFLDSGTGHAAGTLTWRVPLKGHTESCVKNFEAQFEGIDRSSAPSSMATINFDDIHLYPPFDRYMYKLTLTSHIQGFARFPDTNYFIGSRSQEGGYNAGFFLGRLPVLGGNQFLSRENAVGSHVGDLLEFYPTEFTDHPGSIQTIKSDRQNYVVLGADCSDIAACQNRGWMKIYRFDPHATIKLTEVESVNVSDLEGAHSDHRASSAGMVRLANGRYLLGLMQTSDHLVFVESRRPWLEHENNDWFVRNYTTLSESPFENYQLFTDCDTGNLYGVGISGDLLGNGDGRVVMSRILPQSDGTFQVEQLNRFILEGMDHCNPRGGASMFVDQFGTLALYCADKTDLGHRGDINFKEWTP
jgi:hypothetical protein